MAYSLNLNGGVIQIPKITFTGDFSVTIKATQIANGRFFMGGDTTAGSLEVYRNNSGLLSLFIATVGQFSGTTALSNNVDTPDTIVAARSGSSVTVHVNGVLQGTSTFSGAMHVSWFGLRTGWGNYPAPMRLYFCDMQDITTPSNSRYYDPSLSGGTGVVLPTIAGTNAGTQSNSWPGDDSEWIFYSAGGPAAQLQSAAVSVSTVTATLTSKPLRSLWRRFPTGRISPSDLIPRTNAAKIAAEFWEAQPVAAGAALAGAAVGVSSATASLTTAIRMAAAATAIAACSASLSTGIRLQASAGSVSTATASLTTQAAGMTAAAVSQSSATASLTTGIRLAANASGQSSATGQLSTAIRLVAAAVGQSSASASLTVQAAGMAAAAVSVSTVTANLTTGIRLAAVASGVSSSTAALTSQIRLQANAVAQASASGTLTGVSAALSAAPVSRSTVGASLSTAIRLQASTFGSSSCSADLSTQILVQAAAYSVSVVTADLTTAGQLPPKIIANELKVTRITGAYKLEPLSSFSVTSGTQRFVLQQQGNFSITNSTPRFQVGRV